VSYNGSGQFQINTTGQPVVSGTTISSTAFNALTADLATGLSTTITKDGQTTITANIPWSGYKITGLGAATAAADAVRFDQIQSSTEKWVTVSGTDTYVGSVTPALTAYAAGNAFNFVVPNTNTTACTINIDGLGAKSITRDGSTALVAGDLIANSVVTIVYDGTRFQVLNSNSVTNFRVSGTFNVVGATTLAGLSATTGAFSGAVTGLTYNGLTVSTTTGTFTVTNGKTLSVSNSLTLAGTDSTTMTFPVASASIGYINIPVNSQSAAYSTVLSDQGKTILHPSSDNNARTFTIDGSVSYPVGTAITFVNRINTVTIAITTDTLTLAGSGSTGSRTLAANGMATAIKDASGTWMISGVGLT
jgi:hypothetical protein